MRPLFADINLSAIRDNFDLLASRATPSEAIAVVKADAYGHGLVPVARVLEKKAAKLAVACLDEALELKESGVQVPVLILEGFYSAKELREGNEYSGLEWVIHDASQLAVLQEVPLATPCKVWLKINTGMNRLGFPVAELADCLEKTGDNPHAELAGVITHFACADDPSSGSFNQQIVSVKKLHQLLAEDIPLSAANSAGVLLHPDIHYDWVRPGIGIYGGSPQADRDGSDFGLIPAMSLTSEIIACRTIGPGDAIGYGATWTSSGVTRMGVVAIGYGDGYPRQIRSGAPVIVDGTETVVIGRVSMDMLTVDLTPVPSAGIGSTVELWGDTLSADRVARFAGTISYHLFTGVTKRVPRRYLENPLN